MEMKKESLKMDKNQKLALLVVSVAIFTDILIYSMIVPILPQYAAGLGASQAVIGLMFASYAIAFLVTTPVVGIISDRMGRKLPMLAGLAGLFGSTLLFAFSNDTATLIVARALQGVSAGATWTAGLALLADMFPAETRQQATGFALVGSFAGTLLGPAFGGMLYEAGGYTLPFLVAAGLVLVDGGARMLLLKDPPLHGDNDRATLRMLVKSPAIVILAGVIVITSSTVALLEPTLPLHLAQDLGVSPTLIGVLFGIVVIGSVIASPLSYMVAGRFGRRKTVVAGLIAMGILLPATTIAGSFLLEAVIMLLLGAIMAIGLASVPQEMTDIADRLGRGGYGAVYALYNVALSVGMMIGPLAGGVLAGSLGITAGLMIAGAVMVAYALVLAVGMRTSGPDAQTISLVKV
ncbi:MAG: drug efflux system protein MdtG [Methanocella sp. PtaU1.Bin125]|nr:MAG: drug efflux system protein MdtG [Methanocella sp. PtaU1.Bin125]